MSECIRLSDRIPEVALGVTHWTPEEQQHLGQCESCRQEWELVRLASRLDDGLLPAFDAGATAALLRRRLTNSRGSRRRIWGFAGLAAAASVAVLLWTGELSTPSAERQDRPVAALRIPLPELEGLPPAELDSLLRDMEKPTDITVMEYELDDLDSTELQAVLESWEG